MCVHKELAEVAEKSGYQLLLTATRCVILSKRNEFQKNPMFALTFKVDERDSLNAFHAIVVGARVEWS